MGKVGAADHEGRAARNEAEHLVEHERILGPLRLFPAHLTRNAAHLVIGIGDGLERPVLGMWATGLERHDESLPGGVHHRIGEEEALCVDA